MFTIEFQQLKISLFAEVELLSGLGGTEPFALAFNEHGQAGDDEVVRKNGELSGGADDAVGRHVELHVLVLREKAGGRENRGSRSAPWQNNTGRRLSLIDCGLKFRDLRVIDQIGSSYNATNN